MNANAKILKRHTAFSPLSGAVLRKLTAHATVDHVAKGQDVYREGEPCGSMYLLLSGRCQSVIRFQDGTEHELNIYLPGDTFGEGALISRDSYWTTVRVLTDAFLLRMTAPDVLAVLDKDLRLRDQFYEMLQRHRRNLRGRPQLSSLGRVVTVFRLSPLLDLQALTEQLARRLRGDLKRSVLILQLHPPAKECEDSDTVALSQWVGGSSAEPGHWTRKLPCSRLAPGVRILAVENDLAEPDTAVSHLISHMSSLFRYVLLSVPSGSNHELIRVCMTQSDHSLVFLLPEEHSERQLAEWEMVAGPDGLTPIRCVENAGSGANRSDGVLGGRSLILDTDDGRHAMALLGLARIISRSRIGVALSSGGAKSLAHIGVLQVLEEQGIEPDCVAGSSMGACIGALWASGMSGKDLEALALKLERKFSMLRMVDPVFPPRRGFMKGRAVYRWLRTYLGGLNFEDLPRKLYIVVTDMETLEEKVITSGPVLPAIHASMAMPGVIVPPRFRGRFCFDGSIANPLPVSVLQDAGVEHVIAVNTIPNPDDLKQCILVPPGHPSRKRSPWRLLRNRIDYFAEGNLLDIFMRSMHGAQTRVAEMSCMRADVTLRPVSCDGSWHDFSKPRKYLELGRQAAMDHIDALLSLEAQR